MVYAIIYTDGEMTLDEVKAECREKRFVPLMVYREVGKEADPPTLMVFTTNDVAIAFMKRNARPDAFMVGYRMEEADIKKADALGWKFDHLTFPRRMMALPGVKVGFEVLALDHPVGLDYF